MLYDQPARCPMSPATGAPAPYGLDGFGRPASRPLSKSDQRGVIACGLAILLSPIPTAILCYIA